MTGFENLQSIASVFEYAPDGSIFAAALADWSVFPVVGMNLLSQENQRRSRPIYARTGRKRAEWDKEDDMEKPSKLARKRSCTGFDRLGNRSNESKISILSSCDVNSGSK